MAPDWDIYRLIYADEDEKLDLKETPWDLDDEKGKAECIKDISAIANAPGLVPGFILLGVKDEPRYVVGIAPDSLGEERLQQIMANYIDPPPVFQFRTQQIRPDTTLGLIVIPPSAQKPHLIAKDTRHLHIGTCWTRRGSTSALARSSDIRKMVEEALDSQAESLEIESHRWSKQDLLEVSPNARKALYAFVERERTELSLDELKDFCQCSGKSLAGTLKTFYSRKGKDQIVKRNRDTKRWRFDETYRPLVSEMYRGNA
jgi:predicted HTH transcriptional regulator